MDGWEGWQDLMITDVRTEVRSEKKDNYFLNIIKNNMSATSRPLLDAAKGHWRILQARQIYLVKMNEQIYQTHEHQTQSKWMQISAEVIKLESKDGQDKSIRESEFPGRWKDSTEISVGGQRQEMQKKWQSKNTK